ncbi:TetR/AcrR family transcriptional regulator [Sphingobium chungbukense]|uniref:TetR family transcriptional regulator n=1 Tax=Sphingobium chungbukense TaxID=56193 RepID=A0A0M3AQM5_9SPHN|nr:TetR/AcrR family transcriptional regulator [Sphingobium chungbukense]KKW92512.1 TetR family transcriptional regulator [Sphingobium chungbukense]
MRADAKKNYDRLLAIAREAVIEHGADASLRDIARRAEVGMGTLYRHFPTREALLEALLSTDLDALTEKAKQLQATTSPADALATWFREGVAFTRTFGGVVDLMASALDDHDSALHASCTAVRSAGALLLERAQEAGAARTDIDGIDLFALMASLAWLGDQPAFASRVDRLSETIANTILA